LDLITDAPGGPQDPLEDHHLVDAAFLRGVAQAHQKVVRKNALEAARKAIFVLDDVLP